MHISDRNLKFLSLVISIVLHALFLLLFNIPTTEIKTKQITSYKIPIQMVVKKEIIVKKEIGKDKLQHNISKKKKKQITKNKKANAVSSVPQKPTSLPGDRKEPIIKTSIRPVYPKTALNNDWSGEVIIEVVIDKNGNQSRHKIIKSTGYEILDQTFIRTVQAYFKFKSKRVMGKNVSGKVRLSHVY
jgi:TonB family protein